MTIEQAIVERLQSLAAVTAIAGTRVHMMKLPQRPTLPAVRVQQVGEIVPYHLRGVGAFLRTRIQVDAYADEASGGDAYETASNLAQAIDGDGLGDSATGLSGFTGDVGGSPPELFIAGMFRDTRRPMYEPGELRLVRIQQDYFVHWREI